MKNLDFIFYYAPQNIYSFNSLAGALENAKSEINVFFEQDSSNLSARAISSCKKGRTPIVCLSFCTTQSKEMAKLLSHLRRDLGPKILIIAGGPHPSARPRESLLSGCDFVFDRESERTILKFAAALAKGENPGKVAGLYFLKNEHIEYTGHPEKPNLNEFMPFSFKHSKFGAIEITRGCSFRCGYCQTPFLFGNRLRHRSVEFILNLAEKMLKRNLNDFRFITPNAFSYGSANGRKPNPATIGNLLSELKKLTRGKGRIFFGSFPSEIRPEHVNEDLMFLLKKYASNKRIIIGGQSGSERILEKIGREHSVSDILNAAEISVKYGFEPHVDFILGLPGEKKRDLKDTISLMDKLTDMGGRLHLHYFMPLPKTKFENEPPEKLPESARSKLKNFVARGLAYGHWEKQMDMGLSGI